MKDDYFKPGCERSIIAIYFIIIFSFLLRSYQLSFFEFKNDQLQAILLGNEIRNASFLTLFLWFMGVITFFTHDPLVIFSFRLSELIFKAERRLFPAFGSLILIEAVKE